MQEASRSIIPYLKVILVAWCPHVTEFHGVAEGVEVKEISAERDSRPIPFSVIDDGFEPIVAGRRRAWRYGTIVVAVRSVLAFVIWVALGPAASNLGFVLATSRIVAPDPSRSGGAFTRCAVGRKEIL